MASSRSLRRCFAPAVLGFLVALAPRPCPARELSRPDDSTPQRVRGYGLSFVPPAGSGWTGPSVDSGVQTYCAGHLPLVGKRSFVCTGILYQWESGCSGAEDCRNQYIEARQDQATTQESGPRVHIRGAAFQKRHDSNAPPNCIGATDSVSAEVAARFMIKDVEIINTSWICSHPADPRLIVELSVMIQARSGRTAQPEAVEQAWASLRSLEFENLDEVVTAILEFPGEPAQGIAVDAEGIWVVHGSKISRVDPATHAVTRSIELPGRGFSAVIAAGSLWVGDQEAPLLYRFDPGRGELLAKIPLLGKPSALEAAFGSLWVAYEDEAAISRLDFGTGDVVGTVPIRRKGVWDLTESELTLWGASSRGGQLLQIFPESNSFSEAGNVCGGVFGFGAPVGLLLQGGSIWVACQVLNHVRRLDLRSMKVQEEFEAVEPLLLAESEDSIWATSAQGVLYRLNPGSGLPPRAIPIGGFLADVRHAFGSIWVTDRTQGRLFRIDVSSRDRFGAATAGDSKTPP